MVNALAVVVGLSVVTSTAIQQGGGSAAYGQSRQGALEAVRSAELVKRNIGRDDAGRYIDAAVLMNVEADEYVAVFGVTSEGKTLAEAQAQSEATVRAFGESLKALKVPAANSHVDFVVQNRIYGYEGVSQDTAREVVVGFELKKNISVRYSDKALLEPLVAAAGKTGIFDLVKVDYVVRDSAGVREKLMQEAARLIRRKVEDQERLFGVRVGQFTHVYPVQFSTYFPVELYDSYVAQESEEISGYRANLVIQRARKPRTFYFNALTAKDFDHVINPVVTEPVVQFTIYVRVRY